jgi:KH domain
VGLVVGPKGATIKRIQQQTHTYIVTPSRDKEPVFEVTGLPENVDAARKEIEAHIALRTGQSSAGPMDSNHFFGDEDNLYRMGGSSTNGFSSSSLDHIGNGNTDKFSSILNSLDSPYSSLTANSNPRGNNGVPAGITLRSLLDSNNYDLGLPERPNGSLVPWSHGDSHDSGIGNSPPFDSLSTKANGFGGNGLHNNHNISSINGIWGDLSRALGGLDLSGNNLSNEKPFLHVGSRSSLDLGTLGRPLIGSWGNGSSTPTSSSANSSSLLMSTANNHLNNLGGVGSNGHYLGGAIESLPSSRSSTTTDPSPPSSLPFNLQDQQTSCALDQMVCHALENKDSSPENNATLIPETVAFCSDPNSDDKAPLSCAGDFLSFAN